MKELRLFVAQAALETGPDLWFMINTMIFTIFIVHKRVRMFPVLTLKCSSNCVLNVLKASVMPVVRSDFGSTPKTASGSWVRASFSGGGSTPSGDPWDMRRATETRLLCSHELEIRVSKSHDEIKKVHLPTPRQTPPPCVAKVLRFYGPGQPPLFLTGTLHVHRPIRASLKDQEETSSHQITD